MIRRLAIHLALALITILGVTTLTTTAAEASAPSCNGGSCDGLNPADTNCTEDAYTILGRNATPGIGDYGNLELRYSPKCHSNWVRFTPWYGLRTQLGNLAAHGEVSGVPWIWRLGVAHSLRGKIGQTTDFNIVSTSWTAMVTADGTTCSSVGLYETESHDSGMSERRDLGTYNAPCVS